MGAVFFIFHLTWQKCKIIPFIFRFDTRDNIWNLLPSLPVNLFNYYAIEMGGNFYVAGEYDPGTRELRVVIYCFNLANRAWNEMTTLPDAPSITSMTNMGDGRIHFTFKDLSVHLYDPADNTWLRVTYPLELASTRKARLKKRKHIPDWTLCASYENFANHQLYRANIRTLPGCSGKNCKVWQSRVPCSQQCLLF